MMLSKIAFGVVNRELDGRSMDEARTLVGLGEARWVRGPYATLKLVPLSYAPTELEVFVTEAAPDHFVPQL